MNVVLIDLSTVRSSRNESKWALLLLEQRKIQHISREGLSMSSSSHKNKLLSKEDESSTLYE